MCAERDKDQPIVEIVPIESLQPDPRNANLGTERGSYMLNDSLTKRGAGRSILATCDGVILAGNKTHEQAVQAGFTEVIKVHTTGKQLVAVVRDDLEHGSQEATRMAIEDNRIGQASLEFDPAILLEMGKEDATLTDGLWRDDEWEELLGDLFEPPDDEPPPLAQMDKADELQEKWQVKVGDLWEIGRHRLVCGDCTDGAVVSRVMGGELAQMVFTDPPYNVAYQDNESVESLKKRNRRTDGLVVSNDSMTDAEFGDFLSSALRSAKIQKGGAFYLCAPPGHPETLFRNTLNSVSGWSLRQCIVWVKHQFVFGRQDYHYRHESILYGWITGAAHFFIDDRTQDTVWEFDRPMRSEFHPTTKPLELPVKAIGNSSKRGDMVYEPFCGSGTTLVACEQLNRRGRGIEIEPKYCAVTLERLSDMGLVPIRIESQ